MGEICAKQAQNFTAKFRRYTTNLVHPLGLAENQDFAASVQTAPCPSWAFFPAPCHSAPTPLTDPLTSRYLTSADLYFKMLGFIQDLVYLSEVDRIFNLGQVGPCSILNQYGYGGKIRTGQWACLSLSSKPKMRVTEKMGQKICCHKHSKTEL